HLFRTRDLHNAEVLISCERAHDIRDLPRKGRMVDQVRLKMHGFGEGGAGPPISKLSPSAAQVKPLTALAGCPERAAERGHGDPSTRTKSMARSSRSTRATWTFTRPPSWNRRRRCSPTRANCSSRYT